MNIFELFILAIHICFALILPRERPLQTDTANASIDRRMVRGISGINAPCGIFWRTILCR